MLIRSFAVLGVVVGAQLAGCGLISSDVTDFDLSLPPKSFTINAGSWQIDPAQASTFTQHDCSTGPTCQELVSQACQMGCTGMCNARHTCDLSLDVSLAQPVDLVSEQPELKAINDRPVVKVTVDSVTYEVVSNSLSVATPTILVYIAPSSVTALDNSAAQVIGMIDPVPAGATSGAKPIRFTSAGEAALANIMGMYKTPFNVLIGTQLLVTAGQPVPTGKLEAVVRVKGHAGI